MADITKLVDQLSADRPRSRRPRQGARREVGRFGRRCGRGRRPRRRRWPGRGRADRVRRHPHRRRWQEDQRHQGSPRDHPARPRRSQGAGRGRAQADQGRRQQGRSRGDQEADRGSRRHRRAQVSFYASKRFRGCLEAPADGKGGSARGRPFPFRPDDGTAFALAGLSRVITGEKRWAATSRSGSAR